MGAVGKVGLILMSSSKVPWVNICLNFIVIMVLVGLDVVFNFVQCLHFGLHLDRHLRHPTSQIPMFDDSDFDIIAFIISIN